MVPATRTGFDSDGVILIAWNKMVDVVDKTMRANSSIVLSPVTVGFHPTNGTCFVDAGMRGVTESGAAVLHPGDSCAGTLNKFRVFVELTDKMLGHVLMIALCPVPG